MPSDSLVHRVIEQIEGSHYSFIRFVGRVCRHEWEWAPDEGIPSARDVVAELIREEAKLAAKAAGAPAAPTRDAGGIATPSSAATTLRSVREATIATLRRQASSPDEAAARGVLEAAVSLAQLDAHALGSLAVLQRLIDPTRAGVSPR
jgi:hypothetical protein